MTNTAAQRKAAERARHKEAGRVAVTHYVYPEDREKVARYIKRVFIKQIIGHQNPTPGICDSPKKIHENR